MYPEPPPPWSVAAWPAVPVPAADKPMIVTVWVELPANVVAATTPAGPSSL